MLLTIIVSILIIGILVIVHEFGHFIVAKFLGIEVEEFALGFPPKIWSKKKGETKYIINLFPIGGYVKMLGEDEIKNQPRSFSIQPTTKKIAVVVAGVVMNLILAWLILTAGFAAGMSPLLSDPATLGGKTIRSEIIIADVKKDSPAQATGLKQNDQILYLIDAKGKRIDLKKGSDITDFTTTHRGQKVIIGYERDNGESQTQAILSADPTQPLGIAVVDNSVIRLPWYRAPGAALVETGKVFKLTFDFLGSFFKNIFTKGQVSKDVGGPVAIYVYTGMAVKLGAMAVLQFIAILSVNLALINILPFPALDGGKILFLILRRIMGKHFIREKVENIIHTIGFAVLIILMVLITFKDVSKFF